MSALEFSNSMGRVQAFSVPATSQTTNVTMNGSAISSAAVSAKGMYRIYASGAMHIAKDTTPGTPVATTTDMPIASTQPEYFGLDAGDTVSAIGTSGDILSLTLMP